MAESKVTIEEVKKIAKLSNLNLTDDEISLFSTLFTDTLKYINELSELDTANVSETFQVTGLKNVFQKESDVSQTLSSVDALKNASEQSDNLFVTKGVFDR